eukprot:3989131-Alexandrium_andersonii.AAC.1
MGEGIRAAPPLELPELPEDSPGSSWSSAHGVAGRSPRAGRSGGAGRSLPLSAAPSPACVPASRTG